MTDNHLQIMGNPNQVPSGGVNWTLLSALLLMVAGATVFVFLKRTEYADQRWWGLAVLALGCAIVWVRAAWRKLKQ